MTACVGVVNMWHVRRTRSAVPSEHYAQAALLRASASRWGGVG